MSEYQYYEFRALDRPLTEDQQEEVAALSSRAEVTPHSASFVYNYGDFRGDPEQLLAEYFDAMLYMANWGSRRLMFRLPSALIDTQQVELYGLPESIALRKSKNKKYLIVDLEFQDEEQAGWTEGEGWLGKLVAIREELLQGDFRVLYLAWLKAAVRDLDMEDEDDDREEPPVPAGLGHLSPALKTFVKFLDLDEALIAAAAQQSGKPAKEPPQLETWLAKLPAAEQQDFLVRLSRGESNLSIQLNRRLQELAAATQPQKTTARTDRRTIATLTEAAQSLRQKKKDEEQRKAALARQRHLEALAPKESQVWDEVTGLIEEKKATSYERAVTLVVDLRDLAIHQSNGESFRKRLAEIERTYSSRSALLRRLRQSKLIA